MWVSGSLIRRAKTYNRRWRNLVLTRDWRLIDLKCVRFSIWILWYQERQLRECHGWLARLRVNLWGSLEQFKISCYQFYLALYWSSLGVVLRLRWSIPPPSSWCRAIIWHVVAFLVRINCTGMNLLFGTSFIPYRCRKKNNYKWLSVRLLYVFTLYPYYGIISPDLVMWQFNPRSYE
jgi:hypothetical protein